MTFRLLGNDVERLLIVGYGLTGRAAAAFCLRQGLRFSVSDAGILPTSDEAWLRTHAEAFEMGGHTERLLDGADAVMASPGVPFGLRLFAVAAERGIPVVSELDVAGEAADGR
ncbi:MAG: hypothetical protein NTV92_02885, partial [Candidatus Bipolaricaulota bacterium]|nr:hypothetical protein [Candidatus Bipolaricaulota bacterium]